MKLEVYLVRHGETTANRDLILQGHSDYPLTELGISQAEQIGSKLDVVEWTKIYSSDLYRAVHTTRLVLSKSKSNHKYSGDDAIAQSHWLREINFGVREGMPRSFNAHDAKIEYAKRNNIPVHEVVDNAETAESIRHRQHSFILQLFHDCVQHEVAPGSDDVSSNAEEGDEIKPKVRKILCLSHGGYIKNFLQNFTSVKEQKIANCAVSIVQFEWPDHNDASNFVCRTGPEKVNMSHDHDHISLYNNNHH